MSITYFFAELDWVPEDATQCEKRLRRIGHVNSVFIQYLMLDTSLDVRTALPKKDT
jgi:hypothetical protein